LHSSPSDECQDSTTRIERRGAAGQVRGHRRDEHGRARAKKFSSASITSKCSSPILASKQLAMPYHLPGIIFAYSRILQLRSSYELPDFSLSAQ